MYGPGSVIQIRPAWRPALVATALGPVDIHIWRARSNDVRAFRRLGLASTLDDADREIARRYVFEADRLRFMFRRALLRHLLASYLDQDPAALRFGRNRWGKPFLRFPAAGDRLEFNLSSSEETVLVAVSAVGQVGVDLEATDAARDHDVLARHHFPPVDREFMNRLPNECRGEFFVSRWTGREATLKALGTGFMPVESGASLEASSHRHLHGPPIPLCFEAAPGFIGALAWRASLVRLQWFSMETPNLLVKPGR